MERLDSSKSVPVLGGVKTSSEAYNETRTGGMECKKLDQSKGLEFLVINDRSNVTYTRGIHHTDGVAMQGHNTLHLLCRTTVGQCRISGSALNRLVFRNEGRMMHRPRQWLKGTPIECEAVQIRTNTHFWECFPLFFSFSHLKRISRQNKSWFDRSVVCELSTLELIMEILQNCASLVYVHRLLWITSVLPPSHPAYFFRRCCSSFGDEKLGCFVTHPASLRLLNYDLITISIIECTPADCHCTPPLHWIWFTHTNASEMWSLTFWLMLGKPLQMHRSIVLVQHHRRSAAAAAAI